MSKYLFFIILGIILFLYINSIDGLNVGSPDVDSNSEEEEPLFESNESNESNDVQLFAESDTSCGTKLNTSPLLYVELSTNKNKNFCENNHGKKIENCVINNNFDFKEPCYYDCDKLSLEHDKKM